ncbi:MAG: 50S ribosomal protein L28 [Clostridiales bacterium]|nr:50S ribosomal protein L28 [Clostridiales bacterium]
MVCEICDKKISFGIKVSHSHHRTNRTWKPNIKKIKTNIFGVQKKISVCTRCLRSKKVPVKIN